MQQNGPSCSRSRQKRSARVGARNLEDLGAFPVLAAADGVEGQVAGGLVRRVRAPERKGKRVESGKEEVKRTERERPSKILRLNNLNFLSRT